MTLAAKAASDVVTRRWSPALAPDDYPASASATGTGVTVDSTEVDGLEVVLVLSAGTAGASGSVAVTVTTGNGDTVTATLYIPILAATPSDATARDVVEFALRKIYGLGETPPADAAEDALERLVDMLEAWRASGAEIGTVRPLTLSTALNIPHEYVAAVKNNLTVLIADQYNRELSPVIVRDASYGLAMIKQDNLYNQRPAVYY